MALLTWSDAQGQHEQKLGAETCLGRSPKNDIQLMDTSVSSFHARITCSAGEWVLKDSNSTNGSFVNGTRQVHAVLKDGDEIRLGFCALNFQLASAAVKRAGRTTLPGSGVHPAVTQVGTSLDEMFTDDPNISTVGAIRAVGYSDSERVVSLDRDALARRLKASLEISKSTAATLDLSEILERVLDALFEIFQIADRGFILLVDSKTNEVKTATVKHRSSENAGEIKISQTALKNAMNNREAFLCMDAMTDQRFAQAQSVLNLRIHSMMIAPLVFQDDVLGAIYVDTQGDARFAEADLELLSVAASQVAACVANVQLHEMMLASERLAAVGQTVAGLTHCIRNILQGVQGGAYIVDQGMADGNNDLLKSGWNMVKRNNAFMADLVFDLLSYSKKRAPEYESADLNEICRDLAGLAEARAQKSDVTVTFMPDETLGMVEIDSKGVRRAVLNLLMNAVDACAKNKGTVTLETKKNASQDHIGIFIKDTGCGMPEEVMNKLFTVFFSTKGSKGTGLGLTVSKKLIEEHGGRLEVESQEGIGTTFSIFLPPNPPPKEDDATQPGSQS